MPEHVFPTRPCTKIQVLDCHFAINRFICLSVCLLVRLRLKWSARAPSPLKAALGATVGRRLSESEPACSSPVHCQLSQTQCPMSDQTADRCRSSDNCRVHQCLPQSLPVRDCCTAVICGQTKIETALRRLGMIL